MKRSVKVTREIIKLIKTSHPALIIFSEIILGIILSFISLLIFLKIGHEVFENDINSLDTSISHYIYSFRTPILTQFMIFISFLGGNFIIIFSTLIIIFFAVKKHKRESFLFSIILIMGFILNNLIKILVKRPRPELSPLINEPTYSFPSGHSMNSFVFYILISYFIFHFTKNKKISIVISFSSILLILLIGLSRIYLGVHYPSDVIAGFIGGFWWFVTALLIRQTINLYKLFKETKNKLH